MDRPDPAEQRLVAAVALAGPLLLGDPAVVGRGWDLQDPEDGLDPEPVTMLCDEPHDRRRVGSSSWAKKAEAALRIWLARCSSRFSRRSRLSSSRSSLLSSSGRWPRSASARRTHERRVSRLMPSSSAMWAIGRPLEATSSTARSRSSRGYLRGVSTIRLPSAGSIVTGFGASEKPGEAQGGVAVQVGGLVDPTAVHLQGGQQIAGAVADVFVFLASRPAGR